MIASTDAVAADVVGASLLGFHPQAVRHLWEAGRLGLGETETDNMEFPAMSLREAIEAFTLAGLWCATEFRDCLSIAAAACGTRPPFSSHNAS